VVVLEKNKLFLRTLVAYYSSGAATVLNRFPYYPNWAPKNLKYLKEQNIIIKKW